MTKKAFTLIELLAVVVIIAIIATVGIYTITKIINNARIQALSKTALMVRKTAKTYLNSNEIIWINNQFKMDMKPGVGDHENLINLTKDPWGDNYLNVYVLATKDVDKLYVEVYTQTGKGKWWFLDNDSEELIPLSFAFNDLNYSSSTVKVGEVFNLLYTTESKYSLSKIESLQLIDSNGDALATSYYDWQENITTTGLGSLTINKLGHYHIKLKVTGYLSDDVSKTELNSVDFSKDTAVDVVNSIEVYDVVMPVNPVVNSPVNIKFKVRSNLALDSITGIVTPQRDMELTLAKTYATTGSKTESITIYDVKGNSYIYNFPSFTVAEGCSKTMDCVRYIKWEKSGCYWYDSYEDLDGGSCTMAGIKAFNGASNILNMTTMPIKVYEAGIQTYDATKINVIKNDITNFTYGGDFIASSAYEIDLNSEYNLTSIQFIKGWSGDSRGTDAATLKITLYNTNRTRTQVIYNQYYNYTGPRQTNTINSQ